jgi:hypothetical protein
MIRGSDACAKHGNETGGEEEEEEEEGIGEPVNVKQ